MQRLKRFFKGLLSEEFRDEFWIGYDNEFPPIDALFEEVNSLPKIEARFEFVSEEDKVSEALNYCKSLYEEEEKRQDVAENKANVLAGLSGTATAAIVALLVLFLESELFTDLPVLRILGTSVIGIALICLTASTLFSIRALEIASYHQPMSKRIFDLGQKTLIELYKRRAAEYFKSYIQNHAVNSRKLNNYRASYTLFKWAIYLVGILFLGLCVFSASSALQTISNTPTPQASPISSQTVTPTATASATMMIPTDTPFATTPMAGTPIPLTP